MFGAVRAGVAVLAGDPGCPAPRGHDRRVVRCAQQFVEQRSVAQQRRTEAFCARLLRLRSFVDAMRDPVVLHHLRVVDRHQAGLGLEITHRVAARLHDAVHKPVGGLHRVGWLIDEALLHVLPLLGETHPRVLGQRPDVKPGTLPLALTQVGLGGPPTRAGVNCPLVFWAKALTQRRRSALAGRRRDEDDDNHGSDGNQDPYPGSHKPLRVIESASYPIALAETRASAMILGQKDHISGTNDPGSWSAHF